jgi:hypothetical protein
VSPAGEVKNDAERKLDEAVNRAAAISSDAAAVHEAFGAFVRGFDLLRELKDPRAHLQMIATVLHAVRDRSLQLQEELDTGRSPAATSIRSSWGRPLWCRRRRKRSIVRQRGPRRIGRLPMKTPITCLDRLPSMVVSGPVPPAAESSPA